MFAPERISPSSSSSAELVYSNTACRPALPPTSTTSTSPPLSSVRGLPVATATCIGRNTCVCLRKPSFWTLRQPAPLLDWYVYPLSPTITYCAYSWPFSSYSTSEARSGATYTRSVLWPLGRCAVRRAVRAFDSAATIPAARSFAVGRLPSSTLAGAGAALIAWASTAGIVGGAAGGAATGGATAAGAAAVGTSAGARLVSWIGGGGGFGGLAAVQPARLTAAIASVVQTAAAEPR